VRLPPATVNFTSNQCKVGDRVEVAIYEFEEEMYWALAEVLVIKGELLYVHYEGYDHSLDEMISFSAVRPVNDREILNFREYSKAVIELT